MSMKPDSGRFLLHRATKHVEMQLLSSHSRICMLHDATTEPKAATAEAHAPRSSALHNKSSRNEKPTPQSVALQVKKDCGEAMKAKHKPK